jgi:hypothetical protein
VISLGGSLKERVCTHFETLVFSSPFFSNKKEERDQLFSPSHSNGRATVVIIIFFSVQGYWRDWRALYIRRPGLKSNRQATKLYYS